MRIDVLTIFPDMFASLEAGLIGKALRGGAFELHARDIRNFSSRGTVDDRPYGGGAGMVMKVEPIFKALEDISSETGTPLNDIETIVLTPRGERFTQEKAKALSEKTHLALVCGRYEGIDERVVSGLGAAEISIGDYILCGGELPAMVVIESVVRLLPGTLGGEKSAEEESFIGCLLEYPQYTRPPEFRGMKVPPVLLSGDHEKVRRWRRKQAIRQTIERRSDIFSEDVLSPRDRRLFREIMEDRETEERM